MKIHTHSVSKLALVFCGLTLIVSHAYPQQVDVAKQFMEYKAKADMGDAMGQYKVGVSYGLGQGVEKDDAEAVKWYRKAAAQDYPKAIYNLGGCYARGEGVEKNDAEALNWWRKAAALNHPDAQFNLGVFYATGKGVAKDMVEAAKWYRKAADQDQADGQYYLGRCYATGEGVERSDAEALKWLRKSAEQDNERGQRLLADAYERGDLLRGEVFPRDYVEAYAWYSARRESNEGFITQLESKMLPAQVEAGKKRAKELRAQIDAKINEVKLKRDGK